MIVCVLYPRFELLAALGDRRALLSEPIALAPEAGREQMVGEVSAPAEAFGVVAGMRLGEAMSRCPALRLVPPDPEGVRSLWGTVLDRLEGIGAAVESDRAGVRLLRGGGAATASTAATSRCARRGPAGARRGGSFRGRAEPLRRPCRGAAGPAAPARVPPRGRWWSRARGVRRFLAPLPAGLLRIRPELQDAARGARAARDPNARRARRPVGAGGGGALRASGPARARPRARAGHAARPAPAERAGDASGSSCPRRRSASSSSARSSC